MNMMMSFVIQTTVYQESLVGFKFGWLISTSVEIKVSGYQFVGWIDNLLCDERCDRI